MPDPNGSWIVPALSFSARLATLPKDEQIKAFAQESIVLGVTPQTLRRNVLAARYCASHAKGVGMDVKDVLAAALTIEMLMRLERRDRAAALKIRHDVFEGKVTARDMQERLKAAPERKPRGRQMDDWAKLASGVMEIFYREPLASFSKPRNSDIGRLLRVDVEVLSPGQKLPDAIFLSPLDDYSECAGLTIEDQIPFIMAACTVYPQVNVALHHQSEADRIFEVLDCVRRKLPAVPRLARLFGDDDDDIEAAVNAATR